MPLTVLLVDDEPLARAGLRAVLEGQPDIEVVDEPHRAGGLPLAPNPTGPGASCGRRGG